MTHDSAAPVGPVVHRLKRLALTPQRGARRHRHRNDAPATIALLEHFEYRTAIEEFLQHAAATPDLLHDVHRDAEMVLDVGGFVGEWCVPVAARTSVPIHVFEPSLWAIDRLRAATEDLAQVHVHHHGLGARDETVDLARIGPGSTMLPIGGDWERAAVEIRDVIAIFTELDFSRAAVKINIEGAEFDLLDAVLAAGWAARIGDLYLQFHEWIPHAHRRRRVLRRRLRATHRPAWEYPWVWEKWVPRDRAPSGAPR